MIGVCTPIEIMSESSLPCTSMCFDWMKIRGNIFSEILAKDRLEKSKGPLFLILYFSLLYIHLQWSLLSL